MNVDGNFSAPRPSRYGGGDGGRGKIPPVAVLNADQGIADTLPEREGSASLFSETGAPLFGHLGERRPGGEWDDSFPAPALGSSSGLPAFPLGALFGPSPLLTGLSLVENCSPAKLYGEDHTGDKGRPNNRSHVPGLAADTSSLRIRRRVEEREASRERQKLLRSLGVGTRRALKALPGKKGGRMLMVSTTVPPGRPPPSFGDAAMVV